MLRFEGNPAGAGSATTSSAPRSAQHLLLLVLALLAVLLLAGCGGYRGGSIPYNVQNFGQPDPISTPDLDSQDLKIAPLDTLRVRVFQVQDLSGDFQVDLLGNLDLPLIGTVKAADLSMAQLDDEVTRRLTEKYMQDPDVSIALIKSDRRMFTVDGAVVAAGQYPALGSMTLMQAIAAARGVTQEANPRRVAVFRTIDGKRMAAAFDLTSIRQGKMADPPVYSGDIIIVDGSSVMQIQRQILMSLPIIGMFNPLIY
jgi:polysaccharide export outer membrane protein